MRIRLNGRNVMFAVFAAGLLAASPLSAQGKQEAAVKALVQEFLQAEQRYDAAALARLIDRDYVEISPAGEVDEHDRFLGFYAADKKAPWPTMTTSEDHVRIFGDTAVEVLKFTYAIPGPDGAVHTREIRGSFIAQKGNGGWKLLGAQYTGIRPASAK